MKVKIVAGVVVFLTGFVVGYLSHHPEPPEFHLPHGGNRGHEEPREFIEVNFRGRKEQGVWL